VVDGHQGTFDGVHGADGVVDGRANGSSHSDAQAGWPGRDAGLTAREAEVIALITQGLSNQEIAEHASLSINSVKSYIRTSYRKMGVTSRTNAVLWGLDHGFSPERRTDPSQS
jgi:DNA-binding CsgD family transcriptional regulator